MDKEFYIFNFKEGVKSLKLILKVLKLLWSVRKFYMIVIIIIHILNGILPTFSILAFQSLLNSIQTDMDKESTYILYSLAIYLSINSFGYIIAQLNSYLQNIFKIDLNYKISVLILNKVKNFSLSNFESSEVYDKLRRAQNEAMDRPYIVFSILLSLTSQLIGLISFITLLLYWKPWVIFLIISIPIISTIYAARIGHMQYEMEYERSQERRKAWYLNFLITNDIAFKEIKIYSLGS